MTKLNYLTNEELIAQTLVRDDLTELEHELLDRLIRAIDALEPRGGGD